MERINVNEWIYYYFCKREDALNVLINFFRPMVIQLMKERYERFNQDEYTFDENLSKADVLLVECIERYHYGHKTSFTTYYRQCFINVIYSLLRRRYREQRMYKHDATYAKLGEEKEDSFTLNYPSKMRVHDYVLTKIAIEERLDKINNILNKDELRILNLKKQGYNSVQIAKIVGLTPKQVQYRIKKIKKNIGLD